MANILLLIAQDGFQTMEYHEPLRILTDAGHHVVTGAPEKRLARSNVGEEVVVDTAIRNVDVNDFDAIFLIGGPGALRDLDTDDTRRIVNLAKNSNNLLYGAICVSPRILAGYGLLTDLRATGWNGDGKLESIYGNSGVRYERVPVVIDGRVITADGPSSAAAFGEAIKETLSKNSKINQQ